MLVESLPFLAFAFSAGAGTFFAPCAFPLLPGYVSFYLGQTTESDATSTGDSTTRTASDTAASREATTDGGGPGTGRVAGLIVGPLARLVSRRTATRLVRAATVGVLVSLGFGLVYGLLGGVTAVIGSRLLGDVSLLEPAVAGVLIAVGTATALGYDLPTPTVRLPERRRSAAGFVGFGVLYAAAAAGCTGTVFVGIGVRALASGPVVAGATFAAYAAGMSTLMIGLTVAAAVGRETLLTQIGAHAHLIERVMGVLLVAAGVAQLYYFLFVFDGLRYLP